MTSDPDTTIDQHGPAGHPDHADGEDATGIVIVGTCASGKSTLAENLAGLGYRARVVAQEHSEIAGLWARSHPAVVIGLHSSLATVRARRGAQWSAAVYDRQRQRLGPAMAAATVVLDTDRLSPMATLAAAAAAIRGAGIQPGPGA
jgi:hypothetical protein